MKKFIITLIAALAVFTNANAFDTKAYWDCKASSLGMLAGGWLIANYGWEDLQKYEDETLVKLCAKYADAYLDKWVTWFDEPRDAYLRRVNIIIGTCMYMIKNPKFKNITEDTMIRKEHDIRVFCDKKFKVK